MSDLKVFKQLAAVQDLTLGKGTEIQRRNGVDVTVDKISIAFIFDTVADLKAATNTTSVIGFTVMTLGYHEVDDGGGALYNIVPGGTGIDDGGSYIDLNNGRQARQILGSSINLKTFGAKGDGVADDSQTFVNAAKLGQVVDVPRGDYNFANKATFENYAHFHFLRSVKLDFTGSDDYMLEFNGGMQFSGDNVTIDFQTNNTGAGIYVAIGIPTIIMANCILRNSIEYALLSENAQGNGKLDNVTAEDCGRGVHVYGTNENPLASTATLVVNNMRTLGTTGSTGNNYYFEALNRVEINGGDFTGAATTGPNCYRCSSVFINGGTYYDINRGPTVGKRTKHFVISGTRSINCSFAALAPDLADDPLEPDEYPPGYGVVTGNVGVNCGYGCRWQGDDGIISNNYFYGCTTPSGIIRVNADIDTGNPVLVQNNYIVDAGSLVAIRSGSETEVIMRDNITDSTATTAFTSDSGSDAAMIYGEVETHASDFDVRTNVDIMNIDAGVADIDLPANTFGKCRGKEFTFVRGTNVGNVILSINGGSANGSINGGSTYTWPPEDRICKAICVTDDNDYIVSSY